MASVPGQQLTDMWMVDPTMFDPTQRSNQFSLYNNAALPFPPTYGIGGQGPVNAATGKPIASYQAPQPVYTPPTPATGSYATPGMTLNSSNPVDRWNQGMASMAGYTGGDPQQAALLSAQLGLGPMYYSGGGQQQPTGSPGSPGGWSTPNNWYAALQALSDPTGGQGVQTPGATVPLQQGYQPSGGVNAAFLQQRGWGGPGPTGGPITPQGGGPVNQNFMSALAAIQGRPQQF